jgi:hypothetical protein
MREVADAFFAAEGTPPHAEMSAARHPKITTRRAKER